MNNLDLTESNLEKMESMTGWTVNSSGWMVSTLDSMVNTLERPESTEGMTGSMWGLLESVAHQSQDWQGSTLRRSS